MSEIAKFNVWETLIESIVHASVLVNEWIYLFFQNRELLSPLSPHDFTPMIQENNLIS